VAAAEEPAPALAQASVEASLPAAEKTLHLLEVAILKGRDNHLFITSYNIRRVGD